MGNWKSRRAPKRPLEQSRLKELFDYDPETGKLVRKVSSYRKNNAGSEVTTTDSNGYYQVMVDGWTRMVHRVVWCWFYGYDSENQIDHINRVKNDNRISNLREVTHQCNMRNVGNGRLCSSGVKGVRWVPQEGKYQATIYKPDGGQTTIARSDDFIEAVCYRLAAEQCLGWGSCDLESPAYQYLKKEGAIQ